MFFFFIQSDLYMDVGKKNNRKNNSLSIYQFRLQSICIDIDIMSHENQKKISGMEFEI